MDVDSDGVAPPAPGLTPVDPTIVLLGHVEEAAWAGGNSPVPTHLHLLSAVDCDGSDQLPVR